VAGLESVWICAEDLQLVRADRIVSLLAAIAARLGVASPADMNTAGGVYAEVGVGTAADAISRVKLAECGRSAAGELLAGLAQALSSAAAQAAAHEGCAFVFAEQDTAGRLRWVVATQLPAVWPLSRPRDGAPAALTRPALG